MHTASQLLQVHNYWVAWSTYSRPRNFVDSRRDNSSSFGFGATAIRVHAGYECPSDYPTASHLFCHAYSQVPLTISWIQLITRGWIKLTGLNPDYRLEVTFYFSLAFCSCGHLLQFIFVSFLVPNFNDYLPHKISRSFISFSSKELIYSSFLSMYYHITILFNEYCLISFYLKWKLLFKIAVENFISSDIYPLNPHENYFGKVSWMFITLYVR